MYKILINHLNAVVGATYEEIQKQMADNRRRVESGRFRSM